MYQPIVSQVYVLEVHNPLGVRSKQASLKNLFFVNNDNFDKDHKSDKYSVAFDSSKTPANPI